MFLHNDHLVSLNRPSRLLNAYLKAWFEHRTSNEMRPMPPVSGSYIPGTVMLSDDDVNQRHLLNCSKKRWMPVSTAMCCKKGLFLDCRSSVRKESVLWFFLFVYLVALEACRDFV